MRILYLVSNLRRSGPINVLKLIIEYIDKKENEIYVISLSPESNLSLRDEFIKMGANCINLNVSRMNLFAIVEKLIYFINKIKPDIIHSHGFRPDFLTVIFFQRKYHCCSTIHNIAPIDYKMNYGNFIGSIMAYIHLNIIKKLKYPVSCSQSVKHILYERYRISTLIIQNGVDTDRFIPLDNISKDILRARLNLPLDKKIIISTSGFVKRKNHTLIMEAFSNSNGLNNLYLLFLGDGPLWAEIKKFSEDLSLPCDFRGKVSNVLDYLQASDYFISASLSEGLPMAVLEAGSVGLPLILSDIPQHREILKDGRLGYLFKPNNIEELRNIFDKISNEKLDNYLEKSRLTREIVVNNFSARKMSQKYMALYYKIINIPEKPI